MSRATRTILIAASLLFLVLSTYVGYRALRPCESYMQDELALLRRIVDRIDQFTVKHNRLPHPESREDLATLGLTPGGEPHYRMEGPGWYELLSSGGVVEPILTEPGEVVMGFDGPWLKYVSYNATFSCGDW